jgi:hypothetical protein
LKDNAEDVLKIKSSTQPWKLLVVH